MVSKDLQREFTSLMQIPVRSSVVIYHGIMPEEYGAPHKEEVLALRKKYEIPPQAEVLMAIGRLHREKGFDYLIRAVAPLIYTRNNLYLVLVGDGTEKHALQKIAQRAGIAHRVICTGYVPTVGLMLAVSDIFILPSVVRESFGIVLLEAMAAQKPVIASRLGGIPEIVDDGVTGILVTPGDEKELSRAIASLLADPLLRNKMGQEGRKRVAHYFTHTRMIDAFDRLIQRKK